MLNSYSTGDVTNTLKINACSGGIYKTYNESWFIRFHLKSTLSDELFRKQNCFYNIRNNKFGTSKYELKNNGYDDEKNIYEVIVLQMIICGDMEVIAELILKEDFDKYFKAGLVEKVEEDIKE